LSANVPGKVNVVVVVGGLGGITKERYGRRVADTWLEILKELKPTVREVIDG
jgi:hypothetical protein